MIPPAPLLRLLLVLLLGVCPSLRAAELNAVFNAPTDVPLTIDRYTATGKTVSFTLNHAPPTGANLTVIDQTSASFIVGTFANLDQGQRVNLSFGGQTYAFVANYHGGTGNDLVLQWANTRLVSWGYNGDGQLGHGPDSSGSSAIPRPAAASALYGKTVIAAMSGGYVSLAACSDGSLFSWGRADLLGRPGDSVPGLPYTVDTTGVLAGKTVIGMSGGFSHVAVLTSDGTVASWGTNVNGQLGNNTTSSSNTILPVALSSSPALTGKSIVAITSGTFHSVALCSDGTMVSWGGSGSGALGNNSVNSSSVPVAVTHTGVLAGKTVIAISTGRNHTLALCSDNTLVSWGLNASGQLGNGSTTNSGVPVLVNREGLLAGKTITAIAAGGYHSLVLCSDGTLASWGSNAEGVLGINSTTPSSSSVPVAVVKNAGALAGKTVTAIAAGQYHSTATCSDGTAAAWGYNGSSQLGISGVTARSLLPVLVNSSTLAGGERFLKTFSGPLSSSNFALVATAPPPVATALAASLVTDDAGTMNGSVAANGATLSISFEYGTTTAYGTTIAATPSSASGTSVTAFNRRITGLIPGTTYHYRVVATGALGTVTSADMTFTTTTVSALAGLELNQGTLDPVFVDLQTSYDTTVSFAVSTVSVTATTLEPGATVKVNGLLTASGTPSSPVALAVGPNAVAIQVTSPDGLSVRTYTITVYRLPEAFVFATDSHVPLRAGAFHAGGPVPPIRLEFAPPTGTSLMMVRNNGTLPIGGAFSDLPHGQIVALPHGGFVYNFVVNYHGGDGNDLVLQWANTRLAGWGRSSDGQVGAGSFSIHRSPVAVTTTGPLSGRILREVAVGHTATLALAFDGRIASWGGSSTGQLGTGAANVRVADPVAANPSGQLAGKTVVSVSAGQNFAVALCSDGTVVSWGGNQYGQLGDGSNTSTSRLQAVPVDVSGVLAGKRVVSVAAGTFHVIALCSDGTLVTWGRADFGQLGNNSTSNLSTPVLVNRTSALAGKTVTAITAGGFHNIVLCSDGTVAAWGANNNGQLGIGSKGSRRVPEPVNRSGVLAGKTVVKTAASFYHSLALCSDGTVAAWGRNLYGELGNNSGSTEDSVLPVAVTRSGLLAGKTIIDIKAGAEHSLALYSDGTLASWGNNADGQLGTGTVPSSPFPVALSRGAFGIQEPFVAVFCGPDSYHSHALLAIPLPIAKSQPATGITGTAATLAGTANGNGSIANVSFEYGTTTAYGTIVTASPAIAGASGTGTFGTALSGLAPATTYHFRIRAESPSGVTTGADMTFTTPNNNAKLASLSVGDAILLPAFDPDLPDYHATLPFASGSQTITATIEDPNASVAISGTSGGSVNLALPVGTTVVPLLVTAGDAVTTRAYSVTVTRLPAVFTYDTGDEVPVSAARIALPDIPATLALNHAPVAGTRLTLINNTGLEFIQGTFSNLAQGQEVVLSHAGTSYRFVADYFGGTGNDLVLHWADTAAFAWGGNRYGQLGSDTATLPSPLPLPVDAVGVLAGKTVTATSAGYLHSLALCSDGSLAAWGYNVYGQLGNGSSSTSQAPVAVDRSGALAGKTVIAVASGPFHNLALCSDGTAVAWGYNNHGQLGNGSKTASPVPVPVAMTGALAGKTLVAVAAAAYHSFALCSDGTLAAWGYNDEGELGDGSTVSSLVPVAVKGFLEGKSVASVSAGRYHALALCTDGTVAAWGYNHRGQIGNGNIQAAFAPVAIGGSGALAGKTVTAVRAGGDHSLALCSDGSLAAWGLNSSGQLGDGSTASSSVPVLTDRSGALSGKTVVSLTAGSEHSAVLCSDGTLAAWGSNRDGALGHGGTAPTSVPVAVGNTAAPGSRFTSVTSGAASWHGIAIVALPPGSAPAPQAAAVAGIPITLADWRALHFGTTADSGHAANFHDQDGDRVANIIEYAFALNPTEPDGGRMPQWRKEGDYLVLSFTEPAGPIGITYGASFTRDLEKEAWQPLANEGIHPQHLFRVPIDSPRKFMRIEVKHQSMAGANLPWHP